MEFLESLITQFAIMKQEDRDKLTMAYWNKEFSLAYERLEDFVTLAD